jgi:hypothetical protein
MPYCPFDVSVFQSSAGWSIQINADPPDLLSAKSALSPSLVRVLALRFLLKHGFDISPSCVQFYGKRQAAVRFAFTDDEAREVGEAIGIDWNEVKFDVADLAAGMEVELEHGSKLGDATNVTHDDPKLTAMIAWAHLKEDPDYYQMLANMEHTFDHKRTPALRGEEHEAYMRALEPGKKQDKSFSPELNHYVEKYVQSVKEAVDKGMSANDAFKKIKPSLSRLTPDSLINLLWENQLLGRRDVPANVPDLYTAIEKTLEQAVYEAAILWWGTQRTKKAPTQERRVDPDAGTVVERPKKAAMVYRGARYRVLKEKTR